MLNNFDQNFYLFLFRVEKSSICQLKSIDLRLTQLDVNLIADGREKLAAAAGEDQNDSGGLDAEIDERMYNITNQLLLRMYVPGWK